MKLCINCKKCEAPPLSNSLYYICTTPEIQEWEKPLRTSFVTGKTTPIYCDAARQSLKLCGPMGKFYEEHTQETLELREITSGHSPTLQSISGREKNIYKNEDEDGT